jgi:hypothetical protein
VKRGGHSLRWAAEPEKIIIIIIINAHLYVRLFVCVCGGVRVCVCVRDFARAHIIMYKALFPSPV